MLIKSLSKTGDTIVEVMFSFAVFGLIAIMGLHVMQKGIALTQTALEINLARNQMNSQAEALRFLNASYLYDLANNETSANSDLWNDVVKLSVTPVADYTKLTDENGCVLVSKLNSNAFALNPRGGYSIVPSSNIKIAAVYPRLIFGDSLIDNNQIVKSANLKAVEGIWVEVAKNNSVIPTPTNTFYDFHIRACWQAASSNVPITLDTIVRLYVPR